MSSSLRPKNLKFPWRLVVVGLVVVALAIAARALGAERWVAGLAATVRGWGAWGVLAYVAAYVVGALCLVPGAVFTMGAGFAYGPWWGALLAVPAATFSSCVVFVLSRTVLRPAVEERIAASRRLRLLDRVIAVHGARAVVLLRFSPITPFNLLNFAFGVTSLPLRHYALASIIGVLPGSLLYAHVGALATDVTGLLAGGHASPWKLAGMVGGVLLTAGTVVWLGRRAQQELAGVIEQEELVPTVAGDDGGGCWRGMRAGDDGGGCRRGM